MNQKHLWSFHLPFSLFLFSDCVWYVEQRPSKIPMSQLPECVNAILHGKLIWQMWLRISRWIHYPALSVWALHVIANVLLGGRQRFDYRRIGHCDHWSRMWACCLWRWKKGPKAKEFRSRSWERHLSRFCLRAPNRSPHPDTHLDFCLVKLILNVDLQNCKKTLVILIHLFKVCGNFLEQPQETNTDEVREWNEWPRSKLIIMSHSPLYSCEEFRNRLPHQKWM